MTKKKYQGSYTTLLDRHGVLLQEERVNFLDRQWGWQELKSFTLQFQDELIKLEDQNFWGHAGVDIKAIASSVLSFGHTGRFRGASTISMQLVNLLDPELRHRSFYKFHQILGALTLERNWSKQEILEAYLNRVTLKGEVKGFAGAARVFYGKSHTQLFFSERLWLYSFLPSPNATWEQLEKRACRYGKRLWSSYDCTELTLFRPSPRPLELKNDAPHLSRWLKPPGTMLTTIDSKIQAKAIESLQRHLDHLKAKNAKDGAVMVADRTTGDVLAYVGGASMDSSAMHVDHVRARRQAGSVLKPFLYAHAIDTKMLTMNSPLMDSPLEIAQKGFTYRPENHHRRFLNRTLPLKEALGSSLNIPAIRVIDLVTPQNFYKTLKDTGFQLPFAADYYGHSMALGSVDINLFELVQGYLALSAGPQVPVLKLIPTPTKFTSSPYSLAVSSIMSQILAEKMNRIHTFGLESVLNTSSWSAVKTGTSKDMRDNWCVGFTDRYVVGVWVGNSDGEPMWDVTGISGAGPVWHEMVEFLHERSPSRAPLMDSTLVQVAGDFYLPGTEPRGPITQRSDKTLAKIMSPSDASEYAYDPDIPAVSQKILLTAENLAQPSWRLDGRLLSQDEARTGLSVEKRGQYHLELLGQNGEILDEVIFLVKAGKRNF